jgi:hypothetical protein
VEQSEPDGELGVGVAVDRDLGIGPPGRPGGAVLGQQPVEPDRLHLPQLVRGRLGGWGLVGVGQVDGQPLHHLAATGRVLAGRGGDATAAGGAGPGPGDVTVAALLDVDPADGGQQRRTGAQGAFGSLVPQPDHPGPSQGGKAQAPQRGSIPGPPRPPQHPTVQVQLAPVVVVRGSGLEPRPDGAGQQRGALAGVVVDAGGQGQGRRAGAVLLPGPAGAEPAVGQGAERLGHPLQPGLGVHRHRPDRIGAVSGLGRVHRWLLWLPQHGNSRVLPGASSTTSPLTPIRTGAAQEVGTRTRSRSGVRWRLMPQLPR